MPNNIQAQLAYLNTMANERGTLSSLSRENERAIEHRNRRSGRGRMLGSLLGGLLANAILPGSGLLLAGLTGAGSLFGNKLASGAGDQPGKISGKDFLFNKDVISDANKSIGDLNRDFKTSQWTGALTDAALAFMASGKMKLGDKASGGFKKKLLDLLPEETKTRIMSDPLIGKMGGFADKAGEFMDHVRGISPSERFSMGLHQTQNMVSGMPVGYQDVGRGSGFLGSSLFPFNEFRSF